MQGIVNMNQDRRKNVLHIIDSLFFYGGTPRKLLYLARNINKDKYRILVTAFQSDTIMENQFREAGAEIILLKNRKKWDILTIWDVLLIISKYKVKLVNTHFARANLYGRIAALVSRVPVIANEHGIPRSEKLVVKIMDNLLSLFTNKFICNSHTVLREVKKDIVIRKSNFEVVQNGIDASVFFETNSTNRNGLRRQLGINPDDIVIANVSGFVPNRDHKTLIRAFADIHKKFPNTRLLLIGDGRLRSELVHLAEKLGSTNSINFMGYRTDVPSILGLVDIYVDPTIIAAGFGFNVMEAMISGLPVIAASAGVPPDEIIIRDVDGILVTPHNPASLKKAIEELIRDRRKRERLGETSRKKVLEKYNAQIFARNICKIYDEVLN